MSAAFNHMTAEQIRMRLQEISEAERKHTARDMDSELGEVMRNGGNIDAMEMAQLEAERYARRLRVERTALEVELPLAIEREGQVAIRTRAGEHHQLAQQAPAVAGSVCATWDAFVGALEAWEAHQASAASITDEVYRLSQKVGIRMPLLGTFQSKKLCQVAEAAQFLSNRFSSAENEMLIGATVHGQRID